MLKAFRRVNLGKDPALTQLQDNISAALQPLVKNPLLDGLLIDDITLTSGSTTVVNHGLGRKVRGYIVVKSNANVTVYIVEANQVAPEAQLVLSTTVTATISLYVF